MLSIEDLQIELASLENGSFVTMTDDELAWKLKLVHGGLAFLVESIPEGTMIYRARRVKAPLSEVSEIRYPPTTKVGSNGRCNRVGESIFYGTLSRFGPCLSECDAKEGDLFVVSAWRVKSTLRVNHLGYSKAAFDKVGAKRELPGFAVFDWDSNRNHLLREWQGRVFTEKIPEDHSELYRLSIGLKEFSLGVGVPSNWDLPTSFSGLQYPSVASGLSDDNIALFPVEVDRKLDLAAVGLLAVETVGARDGKGLPWNSGLSLRFCDFAEANGGALVWGKPASPAFQI